MARASEFSGKTRKQALARSGYRCEWTDEGREPRCGVELRPGGVHYDHITPQALGGESTLDNCQCLCPTHHRLKTSRDDVPRIRKADRQRFGALNAKTRKGLKMQGRPFPRCERERPPPRPSKSLPFRPLYEDA